MEIPDIKAQNLDQAIVVTVKQGDMEVINLEYNAFSYAYVVSQNPTTYLKTIPVTNAMYEYWQKARAYVDSKNNASNA